MADILQQIYYGRYIMEDILRQINSMACISRQTYYGRYTAADILQQICDVHTYDGGLVRTPEKGDQWGCASGQFPASVYM